MNASRSSFGQNNSEFMVIYNCARYRSQNWYLYGIFVGFLIPTGRIGERRVPPKGETVVPSTHQGIARFQLENAVLVCLSIFGNRRCRPQTGRRYIAVEIVEVGIAYSGRKMKSEASQDMWRSPLVERLTLVLKARKMTFQSVLKHVRKHSAAKP